MFIRSIIQEQKPGQMEELASLAAAKDETNGPRLFVGGSKCRFGTAMSDRPIPDPLALPWFDASALWARGVGMLQICLD